MITPELIDLMRRVKINSLTRSEIDQVADRLVNDQGDDDAYSLLYIVGRSGGLWHEKLVASYLENPDDPMLTRLALQILCSFWKLSEKYVEYIDRFLTGVPWDADDEIRLMAISVSGGFLRDHNHLGIRTKLLSLLRDEHESGLVRESALEALARSLGRDWKEIIGNLTADVDSKWARSVIAQIEARADH